MAEKTNWHSFRVKVDNRQKVLNALDGVIEKTLNEIGDKAVEYANKGAPVDTGALRDSYMKDVSMTAKAVRVGSPLEYAP